VKVGIFTPAMSSKPTALMQSVYFAFLKSGHEVVRLNLVDNFSGDLLVLYGWGGQKQQEILKRINCNYVAFDLGYWDRKGFVERKWRVSINGWHCPKLIINGPYLGNKRKSLKVKESSVNQDGHILLIGSSLKSSRVGAFGWSKKMSKQIREHFPNSMLVYRPKPKKIAERVDCDSISQNCDIKEAMAGAKLVVCRHSNVSIDAALEGVPCVAEDGAGAAIYPRNLINYENQPDIELRQSLINRLAWWQWSILEIDNDPLSFVNWIELQIGAL
jgi:hypothetical protein